MNNQQIIEMFENVADLLAIKGENFRRVLAYRRAAENIQGYGRDLADLANNGALTDIPGIGKTLAAKIEEMLETDQLEFYNRLIEEVPASLLNILKVEGVGPKKAKLFYDELNITTLEELKAAADKGELQKLPRMGKKSEERIIAGIALLSRQVSDRTPLGVAWPLAQEILAPLKTLPGVTKVSVAGSLRRMKETIGDIDLLVAAEEAEPVMTAFVKLPQVETVVAEGPTKSRITVAGGIGVDLRVLPAKHWGTLLSYFSGSQAHNVRLRELAQKQGLSLNEYRFAREDGQELICSSEEEVYQTLGLPYIPPILREDRGEIEAAEAGKMPALVQHADIISDLHMHTTWSDGKMTVLEMARAAKEQGMQYIAITDHSASLGIANGLSVARLQQQAEEVKQVNELMGPDFRILHGTEMEIKADGNLDFPDDMLAKLDFVIASLHVSLRQSREQVTRRMLNAIDNPHVDMIAHPTGRRLPDREPADLDLERIFMAASRTRTILEINANPRRLDLKDTHIRRALALGVRLSINTDAHNIDHFHLRHFGVATAQRGWAAAQQIVNTWPLEKLLAYIG